MERACRVDGDEITVIEWHANRSIVGNHPLAVVRYQCGHWEFVRHDKLTEV